MMEEMTNKYAYPDGGIEDLINLDETVWDRGLFIQR